MPSKSPAQEKLMRAVAHSPEFAKKVDIPQSVGKEFHQADKKKSRQYALPPKKVNAVLDAQSDAAVGLPARDKIPVKRPR